MMTRVAVALVLALAAVATARMAYQFPAEAETFLGWRYNIDTSFTCAGRPYGYYADIENDCAYFHVCFPLADEAGNVFEEAHFSFACANSTRFDQATLTCTYPEAAYPCEEAYTIYESSNANFGVVPVTEPIV